MDDAGLPIDAGAFDDVIVELVALLLGDEGGRGRERVEADLTLSRMAEGYGAVYRGVLDGERAPRAALSPQMP